MPALLDQAGLSPGSELEGSDRWLCPLCGGGTVGRTNGLVSVSFRDCSYQVPYSYDQCDACGEQFFTPAQLDDLNRRAAALARREKSLLAPEDIRAIRQSLGLSQERLERLLGLGPKTVVRWERGTVIQSVAADRLLRALALYPDLLDRLWDSSITGEPCGRRTRKSRGLWVDLRPGALSQERKHLDVVAAAA